MAGTPHLEQAEVKPDPKGSESVSLALELREVGEERQPIDIDEVKVVTAVCLHGPLYEIEAT